MGAATARANMVLVRHGETSANLQFIVQGQTDYPLNANGLRQAQDVAEKLRDAPIDEAFSSPLSRAWVTAEKIMKFHGGVTLKPADALKEMHAGRYEGNEYKSKAEVYEFGMLRAREAGGETLEGFQRRVYDFVRQAVVDNDGRTILVVSHGGTTMALLNALGGNPAPEMLKIDPPANTEVLAIEFVVPLIRR